MAFSYKGAITFGLVYIPIVLVASIKNNDIGFNMIDKKTMSRVKYKKTCVDCDDKEVKNENIVKGYQYEKDKYVIFTDKDFEKIKTQKDKNITIEQFVNLSEVDPIYFDKAYYVKPTGADKAFEVLLEAMEKQKKAGIAKTVLGTKETLVLLRVKNGIMFANTLNWYAVFYDEILISILWGFVYWKFYVKIMTLESKGAAAILPIGMSQVCSCNWEKGLKKGKYVAKGDPMGYFLFGGSDIVMIFQSSHQVNSLLKRQGNSFSHILMGEPYCELKLKANALKWLSKEFIEKIIK